MCDFLKMGFEVFRYEKISFWYLLIVVKIVIVVNGFVNYCFLCN